MPVAESTRSVRVRVPAKVNLHLGVGPLRADGFHELATVYQAVALYDDITAHPATGLRLELRGEGADVLPLGPDNLAWRAASLLASHSEVPPDVLLEIDKAIPVAGGLAGGSADAAGTLLACATLWQTGTPKSELLGLAAQLGSDVPFGLAGGTALGTGHGEQVAPVLSTGEFSWVLAFADFGISTAGAYAELDRLRAAGDAPEPLGSADGLLDALRAGRPERLAETLGNDLQAAALRMRPSLHETLDAGVRAGALAGIVSGSGPTCAFLCTDAEDARAVAAAVGASGTCRSARVASAPAHGARVSL